MFDRRVTRIFLFSLVALLAVLLTIPALGQELLVNDDDFRSSDEVWDFIPDYTGMYEDSSNAWVWTEPGVNLSQYETVEVIPFENISHTIDVNAQHALTENLRQGMGRLGLKVVDTNADLTVHSAMVDYYAGGGGSWWGIGGPFVEVEIYVVDNATGNIISKVRHQAHAESLNGAMAETISDIIGYWGRQ